MDRVEKMDSCIRMPGAVMVAAALVLGGLPFILQDAVAEGWVKADLGKPFTGGADYGLYDVAVGDGDRDGQNEVYVISSGDNCVYRFFFRQDSGTWLCESLGHENGSFYFAHAVAVGDGNDDGQNEVYSCAASYSSHYSNNLFEYEKTDRGWQITNMGALGSFGTSITVGDGNRDGRNEVWSSDYDGHVYMYYKSGVWNRKDIGFAPPYLYEGIYWVSPSIYGAVPADADNDGNLEVYAAASDNHMYRFNWTGSAWNTTDLGGCAPSTENYFGFSGLAAGDADGDGKCELYGCGYNNGSIWRFARNGSTGNWESAVITSVGASAYRICMGDGDSDGKQELYVGTYNKQVSQVSFESARWESDGIGSGNGPIQGIAIGRGRNDKNQLEVYAACQDGHLYSYHIDRAAPSNPRLWSDTHPRPGTWYSDRYVHVLWDEPAFDISGIDGYSYCWDQAGNTLPDETKECEEGVHEATSDRLADGMWYFHLRTRDNSLNWNGSAVKFGPVCIDAGAPYQLALKIEDGRDYTNRSLVRLSLAALDPGCGSGLDAMSFSNDGWEWSGWEDYSATREGWNILPAGGNGTETDGLKTVHARVRDRAGNEVSAKNRTSDSIFLDRAAPEGLALKINGGASFTTSPDVSLGLAGRDPEPASGIVKMRFSNDGRTFGEWLDWGETASWSLTEGAGGSGSEGWRDVYLMVEDRAGNPGGPVKASIFLDRTPPAELGLRINDGAPCTNRCTVDLRIAARDQAPGSEIAEMALANGPAPLYDWRPFSDTVAGWDLMSGGNATDVDGKKTVHLKVRDRAGNVGGPVSAEIFLDRVRPDRAGVTINDGADATKGRAVVLGLSASDPEPSSGVRMMQFSADGAEWSPWEDFAPLREWTLPAGDGVKFVYFRVRDGAGNVGEAASASIRLDTLPPAITNVRVLGITDSSAVVCWSTDEEADSAVDYGTTPAYGSARRDMAATVAHAVALHGLEASTAYHFRVSSKDRAGNPPAFSADLVFVTAAAPDKTAPAVFDVRVLGVTDRLATIGWSTNEPADSVVRWGPGAGYGSTLKDGAFVLRHSLTMRDLAPSTTYHFRVESSDPSGNGPAESQDLTFATQDSPDTRPPAISDVRVRGITDRLAVVSWETDEPSTGALEYGRTAAYGSSVLDGGLLVSHELVLAALEPAATYHLRVGATDASGNGPSWSADLEFSTAAAPDTTPPSISGVRVEGVANGSAVVLWETGEPADGLVEWGTGGSCRLSAAEDGFRLDHRVVLAGLRPDTLYRYRVRSSDPSGNAAVSAELSFWTAKSPSRPDRTPPVISGLAVAGITDVRAVVMWATDELAAGEADYGAGTGYGCWSREPVFGTVHSLVLEGLWPSTAYHLRVRCWDVAGNGPAVSPDITFTTAAAPDQSPPVISGVLVSEIGNDSAVISWRTDEPAAGLVEYGSGDATDRSLSARRFSLDHSLRLTGLSPGTTYRFRITATDPAGNPATPVNGTFATRDKALPPAPPGRGRPSPARTGDPGWIGIAAAAGLAAAAGWILYRRRPRNPAPEATAPEPLAPVPPPEACVVDWGEPPVVTEAQAMVPLPPGLETMDLGGLVSEEEAPPADGWSAALGRQPALLPAEAITALPGEPAPAAGRPVPGTASGRTVRCTGCGARQPIPEGPYPARLRCPGCGRAGKYPGPKGSIGPAQEGRR